MNIVIIKRFINSLSNNHYFLTFVYCGLWIILLFPTIFYGIDYLTIIRKDHFTLYLEWEKNIPYFPVTFLIYYSVFILPFLIPVYVKRSKEVISLTMGISVTIVIAGLTFIVLPAKIGYLPTSSASWVLVEKITSVITGRHNLVPSLHVSLTIVIVNALWKNVKNYGKFLLTAWSLALFLSTLFTHQHHLIDVLSGLFLAICVCTCIGRGFRSPSKEGSV